MSSICPWIDAQFPIWRTSHTVKWEGVWRELGCLARTASFAVREESGHSLKSSLAVCVLSSSLTLRYTSNLISNTKLSFLACNGHRHTQLHHPAKKRCLIEDQPGLFQSAVRKEVWPKKFKYENKLMI